MIRAGKCAIYATPNPEFSHKRVELSQGQNGAEQDSPNQNLECRGWNDE